MRRRFPCTSGLLIVLALLSLAGTSASAAPDAAQTVRAYVAAINAKDGTQICSLLHPAEAKALAQYIRRLFATQPFPCPRIAQLIGSGGGRDNASSWRHATILQLHPPTPRGRGLVSVDVRMLDRWAKAGDSSEQRTTRFWLTRVSGRWVIVRRSSALDVALFSEADPFADEPPATREPRAADVQIPAATFSCSDPIWATDDPAGDARAAAAPWLDIRRIALAGSPEACVTVQFTAPPRPGMVLQVSLDSADHGQSLSGTVLGIDPDGTAFFTGSKREAVAGVDYGMAGPTTLVMWFSDIPGFRPAFVSVTTSPISKSEPLIRTQPLLTGADHAGP